MNYSEVKKFAGTYRKELIPMLKKLGFTASVTSKKHYWENEINITITKVPKNFSVWTSEYSRYDITDNAQRLKKSIKSRLDVLLADELEVASYVRFDRSIPYIT